MSEWQQVSLGSVARVVPGYAFKSKDWCDDGVPVLKIKNIRGDGTVDVEDVDCVPTAILSPRLKKFEVCDNDILLAMTGATAGKVGRLRSPKRFMLNQRVAKLVPIDIDPIFFWSLVSSNEYQDRFFRLADGAAQPNMSGAQIEAVPILLPPLETQRRIASILGAYDDLIEVNRRRIEVLEEMARGLFEELIQDSQANPQGSCLIGELVLKTLGGDWGTEEPDDEHTVEVRVVRGTDFSRLQTGDFRSCPTRFIKSSSADKRLLKPYDVILENSINAKTRASGSTLVATPGMIDALGGSVIAASFCRVFQFRSPEDAVVFHMWCRHLHANSEIARYQVVATNGIANFQTTQFVRDCVLPFGAAQYQKQVEFLVRLIAPVYAQQIANLTTSRDLLLPRLISGQLSVAEATRELEEAA